MSPVTHAAVLVSFPVAAAIVGALVAAFVTLSAKVTSGVQHFAAGVVFAALAGEVLPELRHDGHLPVVIVGFAAGVLVLLALGAYSRTVEARPATTVLPLGLLVGSNVGPPPKAWS